MVAPAMVARPKLEDLAALAIEAGRAIMEIHDAGPEEIKKADGSPVTLADQRAEAIILAGLARLAPAIPVLAEEESAAGRIPDLGALFFCVDPLDGTRDFIDALARNEKRGEFTVNIALVEAGTPVQGVIFAPALDDLYAGETAENIAPRALRGKWNGRTGARLAPLAPMAVAPHTDKWRVTASRRSSGPRTSAFFAALGEIDDRRASSSIKFCWLAQGDRDLYPRFGEVSEWDAAAGHAILAAAGGGLIGLDGAPLRYGVAARNFLIDGFIAYGDAASRTEALRLAAYLTGRD